MLTEEEKVYIKSLLSEQQLVFIKVQSNINEEYLELGTVDEECKLKNIFTSKFKKGTRFKGLKRSTVYIGEINLRKLGLR